MNLEGVATRGRVALQWFRDFLSRTQAADGQFDFGFHLHALFHRFVHLPILQRQGKQKTNWAKQVQQAADRLHPIGGLLSDELSFLGGNLGGLAKVSEHAAGNAGVRQGFFFGYPDDRPATLGCRKSVIAGRRMSG